MVTANRFGLARIVAVALVSWALLVGLAELTYLLFVLFVTGAAPFGYEFTVVASETLSTFAIGVGLGVVFEAFHIYRYSKPFLNRPLPILILAFSVAVPFGLMSLVLPDLFMLHKVLASLMGYSASPLMGSVLDAFATAISVLVAFIAYNVLLQRVIGPVLGWASHLGQSRNDR